MAKFHGNIGFITNEETSPGVYTEAVTEKPYTGDILRNSQRWEDSQHLNSNLQINNRFSIVADSFMDANLPFIRYIQWAGAKWAVQSIETERPRVLLTVGGLYNG